MLVKYIGGRSRYEISLNRKSYHFTPENNKILDIQEKEVINYIFSLPNRSEFEVVIEPILTEPAPIVKPKKIKKKKEKK